MMSLFVNFLIESSFSLAVFALLDLLLFSKGSQFKIRRYFLLFAVLLSAILPFIHLNFTVDPEFQPTISTIAATKVQVNLLEAVNVYANGVSGRVGNAILQLKPTVLAYLAGSFFTFLFIASGLLHIAFTIIRHRKIKLKGIKLVVSSRLNATYSFFNIIFINRALPREQHWKSIILHELAHVRQLHSLDILVLDFMMMLFWFNPFYWIIRRSVKENHEFLADAEVLSKGVISKGNYKALLLNQVMGGKVLFTSNFKMKSTQKRFKMMSKMSTNKFNLLKISLAIVVAFVLTLSVSMEAKVSAQTPMKYQSSEVFIYKNKIVKKDALDITKLQNPIIEVIPFAKFSEEFSNLKSQIQGDKVVLVYDLADENEAADHQLLLNVLGARTTVTNEPNEGDEVFVIVEQMPEFPGGEKGLRSFIAENVTYPPTAIKNGIKGRVYVQYIVEKDGSVGSAKVIRGVDPSLDAEALRVVNMLPKYQPGKQRGKLVRVSYTIPINFSLM